MKTINISRTVLAIAVAGALATTAFASEHAKKAAAPATPAVQDTMFAHVKVMNATPEMLAAIAAEKKAAPAPAMRAYLDTATGRLRAPTADDISAEAAAASPARAAAKSAAVRSFVAPAVGPEARALENGAVAVTLDESSMSYSIATLGSDGKVTEDCVTDKRNQQEALAAAKAQGADRHEK